MNNTTNNGEQNKNTKNILNNGAVCSDVLTDKPIENTKNSDSQVQDNTNTDNARVYNIQNLKMFGKDKPALTSEEAKRRGRQGGLKSGEIRRQRKTMKETLESALMMELSTNKLEELGADISLMNGDNSVLSAIVASAIREAINGDIRSLQTIRDTIGEQPTIKQEITETITKEDKTLMDNLSRALIG